MVAIDREEQIRDILAIFEDRLTSPKPESNGSWFELSRMLDGAPPWRAELNRRWASREDWKRFLEWEIDFRAEQWNRDSLPAGRFPKPIRPRGNQGREAEVFAGFVVSESGAYFVQLPQDNEFGFSLFDADQSWPGGIGAARTWTAVARESVPAEAERALGWILDEFQPVNEEVNQAAG